VRAYVRIRQDTSSCASIPADNLPPGVRGRAVSCPQEVRSLGVNDAFLFGGEGSKKVLGGGTRATGGRRGRRESVIRWSR
jgi:hypothetical protein